MAAPYSYTQLQTRLAWIETSPFATRRLLCNSLVSRHDIADIWLHSSKSAGQQYRCGQDPSIDANWDSCVAELRGYVLGNVSMVKGYTAVGGYCRSHDICWDSLWFRTQSFSERFVYRRMR